VRNLSPFFLSKELQRRTYLLRKSNSVWSNSRLRARIGALPVDFWMLNFAEIQHRVASLTFERTTTFTRHHAFLKKATQKLS